MRCGTGHSWPHGSETHPSRGGAPRLHVQQRAQPHFFQAALRLLSDSHSVAVPCCTLATLSPGHDTAAYRMRLRGKGDQGAGCSLELESDVAHSRPDPEEVD
ncbi:hypothetical protein lerEdw1_005838 [Lerista edwardsae]|nr:hypothetical protein lerEdw1_005838 [Lerista edwardsae]